MTTTRLRTVVYTLSAVICLIGLAEATYLAVLSLTGATAVCSGSASCFEVLGSRYAKIGGIPVAGFGAVAYFIAFSAATFAAFDYVRARLFFAAIVAIMFLTTLWLLYLQAFVLHAFCRYCLFSAAMIFFLAGMAILTPSSES
jgi:uncharacterized membrane protein